MTKDDYKFYLPYLGTILILMGAIKLIIYYSLFNLNITSYLEFTEILTLFLSDLLYILGLILFQNIVMFLFQPNNELNNISEELHKTLTQQSIFKRIKSYAENGINLILLSILWIIGIPFWIYFSNLPFTTYLYFFYAILGGLFILTIIYETRRQWLIKFNEHPKMIYVNLVKLFIVLFALTLSSAYQDYSSVKYQKKYLGTTIKLDDKIIVSDSSYYYIGKTKNYVFLHNEKNMTNDVIPMSEIKMITEKKNSH